MERGRDRQLAASPDQAQFDSVAVTTGQLVSPSARIGAAFRSPLNLVLVGLFVAALLIRAAAFVRLDYAAWWDGAGWGYSDAVWIGKALRLADGDVSALSYRGEGLMFIPVQALLFKVFDIALGFQVWAWFLVVSSALVVPIAAHTVFLATGRLVGAVLTGAFVIFDPVASWFGLNGWSDGQTMIAVAFSCWMFMLCARRASLPRQLILALSLSVLALGHATWTYPAFVWALFAWPLLASRARWFPRALPDSIRPARFGWMRTLPVPSLFLVVVLAVVLSVSNLDSDADQARGLGTLFGDTNNQRALVVTYDPSVTWYEWETRDSIRVIFTIFPTRFPEMLATIMLGHLDNVVPLYRWLLMSIALSTFVIVLSRWRHPFPSPIGTLGIPVIAILFLSDQAMAEPSVMLTYLVLGLAWMYVPLVRALTLLFIPFLTLMTLYVPLLTQTRHTNAIVFFVFLVAGICLSLAFDAIASRRRGDFTRGTSAIRAIPIPVAIIVLVIVGVFQAADAAQGRRSEAQYLAWISTQVGEDSIILTSPNVDPWEVRRITGASVLYDAENGGRLVLADDTPAWGVTSIQLYSGYKSSVVLFDELRLQGHELWFYSPWDGADPGSIAPNLIPEDFRPEFQLVSVGAYPAQPGRSALKLGPPLVEAPD
jgi:hypothetical protein